MKLKKISVKICSQHCSKIDKSESTNVSPILLRRVQRIRYATWRFGHTLNSKHSAKTNNQDSSRHLSDRQPYSRFFLFHFLLSFSLLFFFFFFLSNNHLSRDR